MAQYLTCPYCGANLDVGEKCDCDDAVSSAIDKIAQSEFEAEKRGISLPTK